MWGKKSEALIWFSFQQTSLSHWGALPGQHFCHTAGQGLSLLCCLPLLSHPSLSIVPQLLFTLTVRGFIPLAINDTFSLLFPRPTFPAHANFTSNVPRLFYCSRWNLRLAPSAHDVVHLDFWPRRRPQSHKSISSPVKISREYLDSPVIMGTWFWLLADGKSGNLFPWCCLRCLFIFCVVV